MLGRGDDDSDSTAIPRCIWTYWHAGEAAAPPIVRRCIARFRDLHPGWAVRCVEERTLHVHLPDDPLLRRDATTTGGGHHGRWWDLENPAARSDYVRLALLARHGGVWLDASVLLLRPLTDGPCFLLEDPDRYDIQGFRFPGLDPPPAEDGPDIMETGAFACRPGARFVVDWLAEWTHAVTVGPAEYCRAWTERADAAHPPPVLHPTLLGWLPYLAVNAAWSVVVWRWRTGHGGGEGPAALRCRLRPSHVEGGFYALHQAVGWDSDRVAAALAGHDDAMMSADAVRALCECMCKLRAPEREALARLVGPVRPGSCLADPEDDGPVVVRRRLTLTTAVVWLSVVLVVACLVVWSSRRRSAARRTPAWVA